MAVCRSCTSSCLRRTDFHLLELQDFRAACLMKANGIRHVEVGSSGRLDWDKQGGSGDCPLRYRLAADQVIPG